MHRPLRSRRGDAEKKIATDGNQMNTDDASFPLNRAAGAFSSVAILE